MWLLGSLQEMRTKPETTRIQLAKELEVSVVYVSAMPGHHVVIN